MVSEPKPLTKEECRAALDLAACDPEEGFYEILAYEATVVALERQLEEVILARRDMRVRAVIAENSLADTRERIAELEELRVAVGKFLEHPALEFEEGGPVTASHYALNALWDAYEAQCDEE